jgi:hypothetical protein
MRMKTNVILVVVAVIVGALHPMAQFLLWASMSRTDLLLSPRSRIAWSVVSFPLFVFLPREFTTRFFWIVFGANSLLWAGSFLLVSTIIGAELAWLSRH